MSDKKRRVPERIMCWYGQWPLIWAGTWALKRYPADAEEFVRKDVFDRVEAAAKLGLEMARANGLTNTAETIAEALEGQSDGE